MNIGYSSDVEAFMRLHYSRLSEKEKRRYAAVECQKLGYGGQTYLKRLLGVERKTIQRGKEELLLLSQGKMTDCKGVRKAGGGRKKTAIHSELDEQLRSFIEQHKTCNR